MTCPYSEPEENMARLYSELEELITRPCLN
jgi:hypothetical protein